MKTNGTDINETEQVIGESENEAGERRAFLYDPEAGIQSLALGGTSSHANVINDAGQVVGYGQTADGETHAFLYTRLRASMTSMTWSMDPKGFVIRIARFINGNGDILAEGSIDEQGKYQPLLARLAEVR